MLTGRVSRLIVLDLDGPEAVAAVRERGGLPPTPCARTGKGWHVYLAHPGGHVPNAVVLSGVKGLDLRSDGGYVVAPPSLHPSGRKYTWAKGRSPWETPLAPCPEWLLELVEAGKNKEVTRIQESSKEPGWVEQLLAGVPEGMRDDACTRLAGHFLAKGLPESEVLALLLTWNQRNQPPLPESQVEKCVRSVARREARKPPRRIETPVIGKTTKLSGRVAVPEGWDHRVAAVTLDWSLARETYASGKAVVVAFPDLTVPPEAVRVLQDADELEVVAGTEEERARLEWALYPLLIARQTQVQAQAQPATISVPAPAPVSLPVPKQGHVAQERPAPRPALPPGWRPEWEKSALEWAKENAPHLAAAVLALEKRARLAWAWEPDREWEIWCEWELARRDLRRAWEEATRRQEDKEDQCQGQDQDQEQEREQGQGQEEQGQEERELSFADVEVLFGGFEQTWDLSEQQAAALDALFARKGPVLVRTNAGWFGAEEWQERLQRVCRA